MTLLSHFVQMYKKYGQLVYCVLSAFFCELCIETHRPNYTYVVMCIFIELFFIPNFVLPACRPNFPKVVLPAPREMLRGPGVMCGSDIRE